MRWIYSTAFTVATVLNALAAPAAAAQDASDTTAQAQRDFEAAGQHYAAGRYALAADGYKHAYDLLVEVGNSRAPLVLWNVAQALMHIPGRESEVRAQLQTFLDESNASSDDSQLQEQRSRAVALIAELDARERDAARSADTPPAPSAPPPATISPIGPIVLASGAAVLIAGAITGAFLIVEDNALAAMCNDGVCPSAARAHASDVQDLAIGTDILLITGGAAAVTGILMTLLLREQTDQSTASIACTQVGCAAVWRGRF